MNKAINRRFAHHAKRRNASPKLATMQRITATGKSYTIRYAVPKRPKAYSPNETSQFGASAVDIGDLNAVGGWS